MGRLKYLLIMPRLVQTIGDGYSFPLGIAYVSGSMKEAGFDVTTLNLNHVEGTVTDIISEEIERHNIDVVATGGLSFQYPSVREIVETVKTNNPETITVVGGGIISSDPIPAMQALEYVDYGVIMEGEHSMCELCYYLEGKASNLPGINGLIYKEGHTYRITPSRDEIRDLDRLAWPDYEGFNLDKYLEESPSVSGINRKNTVFMISSRSCPYSCTFCFHTTGKKYRKRSLDSFFEELDHMVQQYKIGYVCVADELFSADWRRVIDFCERIKRYGIKWWAQFRCDHIEKHPELITHLKNAGCETMSFGLESADNRVLKSMDKKINVEAYETALDLVYKSGISLEGAFIFGDPAETTESANNTINWWKNHLHYKISLNLITVYPGTPLYFRAIREGLIKNRIDFLRDGCPQIKMCNMTEREYGTLIRRILELPMTLPKSLAAIEVNSIDYLKGRMSIAGTCVQCRARNIWNNLKLFSSSFMACKKCGQKYNVAQPPEAVKNISENTEKLINRHGKICIWGVNYHLLNLVDKSAVLRDSEEVFFVDSSKSKQLMDLFGKKVFPPDEIAKQDIKVVIIPIPAYYNEIEARALSSYPCIKHIIDITWLMSPNYETHVN